VKRDLGLDLAARPGAGSAGGCGYGLMTFFGAEREEGFQLIRHAAGLDALIRAHDLVITGEGSFDRTSLLGKAPAQLGRLARRLQRPVWAFVRSRGAYGQAVAIRPAGGVPEGKWLARLTPAQHAKRLEALAERVAREEAGDFR